MNVPMPPLVATTLSFCVPHKAIGHDGLAWNDCKFRQLFYFENPMDEHTLAWSDELGPQNVDEPTASAAHNHELSAS